MFALLFLVVLMALPFVTIAQSSVSVDDTSSLITSSGPLDWESFFDNQGQWSGLYNDTSTFSAVPNSWLSFTFSGINIEYWSRKGPQYGQCVVTIAGINSDGLIEWNVWLNNSYALPSASVFSKDGLDRSKNYTLELIVKGSGGCELDRFVYTPLPPMDSPHHRTFAIPVGAGIGAFVALLLCCIGVYVVLRRRRHRKAGVDAEVAILPSSPALEAVGLLPIVASTSEEPLSAASSSTVGQSGLQSTSEASKAIAIR